LAAGLRGLIGSGTMRWVFAAQGDGEAEAVRALGEEELAPVAIAPATYREAYEIIANEVLWYCAHGLFDLAFEPLDDWRLRTAWTHYEAFNADMAEGALAEARRDDVLVVNDYHLLLAPERARRLGWTGPMVLFLHTPVPEPEEFAVLPAAMRSAILDGIEAADVVGVHARAWAARLEAILAIHGRRAPRIVVAPLPADIAGMLARARDPTVIQEGTELDAALHGLPAIVRVDRIEPSKNLLRGIAAIDRLFELYPELRGSVRVLHFAYPSREGLDKYRRLRTALEAAIQAVNDRWRSGGWEPIHARLDDNPSRSVAAYARARVLLINPIRDGLNLVAAEASLLAPPGGQLVLSRTAGIAEHVGDSVVLVDPFDVEGTAHALREALARPGNLEPVRQWVRGNTWERWLAAITPEQG